MPARARTRIAVGTVDEVPPGGRKIVPYHGGSLGVFNVDGEFVAFRNYCPHHGAPVCVGTVGGQFVASPERELRYEMDGRLLSCPWHHWKFDLKTGGCVTQPAKRLKRFRVVVDGEQLSVEL